MMIKLSSRRGVVILGTLVACGVTSSLVAAPALAVSYCPSTATIVGTSGNNTLRGTSGNDIICGLGGTDTIDGLGGNDRIYGGDGADVIRGGAGNDQIEGGPGADTISGDDGNDSLRGDNLSAADQPTSDADDVILAGPGSDYVAGGPGDDVAFSGGGGLPTNGYSDVMDGNDGNDALIGQVGTHRDAYSGGAGNDILYPPALRSGPLGNTATGGSGSNVLVLFNWTQDAGAVSDKAAIPVTNGCAIEVPLPSTAKPGDSGTLKCTLPWPKTTTKVDPIYRFTATVGPAGDFQVGGDLFSGLVQVDAPSWRSLARGNFGGAVGICICDPYKNIGWAPMGDIILY